MQRGFVPLYLLVGALILAALGGAYYFGKLPVKPAGNDPKACTEEAKVCPDGSSVGRTGPNCEFTACPIDNPQATDETANWKTYIDTQLRISFKYPSNGDVQRTSDRKKYLYLTNDSQPPYYIFSLEITDNTQNLTARQVLENEIEILRNNKYVPGDGARILADYRQSTIRDYRSGLVTGSSMRWGHDGKSIGDTVEVVSINGSNIYTFSIHDGDGAVTDFQKELIDKILSTFKFTD